MVGARGYTKPKRCESSSLLLSKLAEVRTWGGHVLANYGTRPDGEMPDCVYRQLADLKAWMARSGRDLPFRISGEKVILHLPPGARMGSDDVVAIEWP
jgi:alpha-L-fucosidase